MVVPSPGSKGHTIPDVPITNTADGLSNRDIAIAVIADKLGIPQSEVNDETDVSRAWHEISMVIAFKTGKSIRSSVGMKAVDLLSQI